MPLIDENNRVGGIQRDIFAPREEAGRYNLYTVKSSDNCEHKN